MKNITTETLIFTEEEWEEIKGPLKMMVSQDPSLILNEENMSVTGSKTTNVSDIKSLKEHCIRWIQESVNTFKSCNWEE